MDGSRFDALSRAFASGGSRRTLLRALGGGMGLSLPAWLGHDAAAACRRVGARCHHTSNCCPGSRCRHGKCRCKPGWTNCNQEGLCRQLSADPEHCGACNTPCDPPCCAGGECRELCNGACCAECFGVTDNPKQCPAPQCPAPATLFCCADELVCSSGTADPADDFCCWPNEVCLTGSCCCDGCQGTKPCGGKCCPAAACCNGKCCPDGLVCGRPNPKKPAKCVAPDRTCTADDQCFGVEECRGGVCCSGVRLCLLAGPGTDPVCCPVGKYCDLAINTCCPIGQICNTSKKVRIRPG